MTLKQGLIVSMTRKMTERKGGVVVTPDGRLGYIPSHLVKILGRRKDKQSLTQYITAEEYKDDEGENRAPNSKPSAFDLLNHMLYENALLCLAGWEKIRPLSLLCFVDKEGKMTP